MNTSQKPSDLPYAVEFLRTDLCRILITCVELMTICFGAALEVHANPVNYVLSGVTAQFGTATVSITGTLTYDPTTQLQSAADITLSGTGFPYVGIYNDNSIWPLPTNVFPVDGNYVVAYRAPILLELNFFPAVLSTASTPVRLVNLDQNLSTAPNWNLLSLETTFNVTGSVVPAAVPEPSTLLLLMATGLTGLVVLKKGQVRN